MIDVAAAQAWQLGKRMQAVCPEEWPTTESNSFEAKKVFWSLHSRAPKLQRSHSLRDCAIVFEQPKWAEDYAAFVPVWSGCFSLRQESNDLCVQLDPQSIQAFNACEISTYARLHPELFHIVWSSDLFQPVSCALCAIHVHWKFVCLKILKSSFETHAVADQGSLHSC